jgi:hypothetical protein
MSTSDFLFQTSAPSVWTSPTWTNQSAPEWWQAAAQGLIGRASQIAGQPYQPYAGPRIAGFSDLQNNAMQNTNSYVPGVNDVMSSASSNLSSAGTPFNRSTFDQFMSPYTDNVVNRIAQLGQRNLSENLLPAVNDTFIRSGQFGSSRNADFTLRALRDTNESILGQQASALESAQNNAMQNYDQAMRRQLQSGQAMGALGQFMGTEARNQLGFANTMGMQQQTQNQRNLDQAYSDFTAQRDYPLQMVNTLNSVVRGFNPGNNQSQYSGSELQNPGASPLLSIANIIGRWGG